MAYLCRASASECKHQPHPLIQRLTSPNSHRLPALSPPECHRPETHKHLKARALPTPPARAIPDRRPRRLCSKPPPSPAHLLVWREEYVLSSAALDHRSRPPRESPRPS